MRLDVALAVVAVLGQEAQQVGVRPPRLQQLRRDCVHLPEAVVAENEVQPLVGVDERAGHVVEHGMEQAFLVRQIAFRLFLVGDVGDHRHRAARRHATAQDAVPAPVRAVVLEALARRVAQTLDAPRHVRLDIALAVIAVLGQVAQHVGVRPARLQQLRRKRVHLPEAIVAENESQLLDGVDERAGHVVEQDKQPVFRLGSRESGCVDARHLRHACLSRRELRSRTGEPVRCSIE
ncbi:MAG: hypothetical protein P8Y76_14435 [bacterium]